MQCFVSAKLVKQNAILVPKFVVNVPYRYIELTFLFNIVPNEVEKNTELNVFLYPTTFINGFVGICGAVFVVWIIFCLLNENVIFRICLFL